MAAPKTKAIAGLAILDIARQAMHAWSAKREAERERIGFGKGIREDALQLARDARGHLPERLEWGLPPWRSEPTLADRARTWLPVAVVVAVMSAIVVLVSRHVAHEDADAPVDEVTTDSRVLGAVRAGSRSIDAGVDKVVGESSVAAVGGASALGAASGAVHQATVKRAKDEVNTRVVRPAKRKAIIYGSLGMVGLTVYVVLVAAATYAVIATLS